MIKLVCLIIFFSLFSCHSSVKDNNTLQVSILRGPSAIAFAQWLKAPPVINGRKINIKIVDSPEIMQASLIKQEADIAVLPMINAANLYNKGINYTLAGCPVWGTLFLVEKNTISRSNNTLYVFGSGTTPDILTRYYLEKNGLSYDINYSFTTAGEMMLALQIGKIDCAVLSEPFLSMALNKDSTLQITANLNNFTDISQGFAQTAVLLNPTLENQKHIIDSLLLVSCLLATTYPEETICILEEHKIFPDKILTKESIERCKIQYIPAISSKESIYSFLSLIMDYEPQAIGGKLPDMHFIIDAP